MRPLFCSHPWFHSCRTLGGAAIPSQEQGKRDQTLYLRYRQLKAPHFTPPVYRTLILHSPASYSWSRPSRQASGCPSRISTGPLSTAPCTRAHQPSRQSANLHLDAHHTSPPGRIVATCQATSAPFTLLPSLTLLHPSTLFRPPHSFPPHPRCTPSEASRETLRPTYRFNCSPGALPILARLNCRPLLLLHLEPSRCDVIARQPLKSWRQVDQP